MKLIKGQSLVELMIAIALAALLLPALLTGFIASRSGRAQQNLRLEAVSILKTTQEEVRSVRENGWSTFAAYGDGTFYPSLSGSSWQLVGGSQPVSNGTYVRKVQIISVNRDSNGAIAGTGTTDPSTKKITTTVYWGNNTYNVSSTYYLTRYRDNISYTETTKTQFDLGTKNSVVTELTSGSTVPSDGDITLGAGGTGDWCSPSTSIKTMLDLPGQGVTTFIGTTYSQGNVHAYTTTGNNASGDALDSVTITDPTPPGVPSASVTGNYNSNKAYAAFAGGYVYIGSDHPGLSVIILNPTTLAQVGFFDPSGGERPANSIFVSGTTGYAVAGSRLYAFDMSTLKGSSSQTELWKVSLSGTGKKVLIGGGYAFIATSSTTNQFQIVRLSDHTITSFSVGNNLAGVDVSVDANQSYAYFVTTYASGKNDFFIIDISNKTSPQIVGTYSTNGMTPKAVTVVPVNRAIIVGTGGQLYQVINIVNKNSPTNCGQMTPSGVSSINAVSTVQEPDGDVYSYILTDNSSQELQVIEGGPGGGAFVSSGTFISKPYDVGYMTAFNRYSATSQIPSDTTLRFQVAVANQVGGTCNHPNYTYVGPGGSTSQYFTTSTGTIPFGTYSQYYQNPGRCISYKVYFDTTNTNQSPVFYDFTMNYSP